MTGYVWRMVDINGAYIATGIAKNQGALGAQIGTAIAGMPDPEVIAGTMPVGGIKLMIDRAV